MRTARWVVLFGLVGILLLTAAVIAGAQDWTITFTGQVCTTATATPIACTDPLAAIRTVTFDVNKAGVTESRARTFSIAAPKGAIVSTIRHLIHQEKYPVTTPDPTVNGTTVTIK